MRQIRGRITMIELTNERIEEILKETKETEPLPLLLRAIYLRYVNLYENYFAKWDELTNDKIAEFNKQHEETKSLIKYYYMDIPQDVCSEITEFEEKCGNKLLGRDWKMYLYDAYDEFRDKNEEWDKSEDYYKAEFTKYALKEFYEAMDDIFREGFGTGSATAKGVVNGLSGLLFGRSDRRSRDD